MTLDEAEAAERAAFAAIGQLGERELAAVKAWIASGCEGPKPQPDEEQRRILFGQLKHAVEAHDETAATAALYALGAAP